MPVVLTARRLLHQTGRFLGQSREQRGDATVIPMPDREIEEETDETHVPDGSMWAQAAAHVADERQGEDDATDPANQDEASDMSDE